MARCLRVKPRTRKLLCSRELSPTGKVVHSLLFFSHRCQLNKCVHGCREGEEKNRASAGNRTQCRPNRVQ
jgi:hypothetical protein